MPNPQFDNLNTLKSDRVPSKADKLAGLLSKELGVKVARYAAIRIAVDEAIAAREQAKAVRDA